MLSFDIKEETRLARQLAGNIPDECWAAVCYAADSELDKCTIQFKKGKTPTYLKEAFTAFLTVGDHLAGKVSDKGPYIPHKNFTTGRGMIEISGRGLLKSFAQYYRRFVIPNENNI